MTEADKPWVFEKGGRPALIVSTLEPLAVLFALKLFRGETHPQHRTSILRAPTWIGNKSNGAALNRLMTSRYPASAVLAAVQRPPRTGNVEADALAN